LESGLDADFQIELSCRYGCQKFQHTLRQKRGFDFTK
jgi:hypothetical protein